MTLVLKNITKNWDSFALKNINLSIARDEYLVLLGPTGAGKTLLLETIMGFNIPDEGRIIIDNQDVTNVAPEKRGIGYVPQDSVLFPNMTVRQNIVFGLKMQSKDKVEQDKTADELLKLVGLKHVEHRLPDGLSGGEKQKVALARVLAIDSRIVLLDEPLASVDAETTRQLRAELKRIHKEQGKTVIHVTHSLIEGFGLADKLALMMAGEIVQVGEAKELLAKPKNEFIARVLGYENIYKAKVVEKGPDFSVLDVEGVNLKISGAVDHVGLVAVQPENITVELSCPKVTDANVLKGRVTDSVDLGPVVMVTVETGLLLKVVMAKNFFIENGLEDGRVVWLKFQFNTVKIIE